MYTITLHDPRLDGGEEIAELVAWTNVQQARVLPDEAPGTVEDASAQRRAMPARHEWLSLRARDADGVLVGAANTVIDPTDTDNPDIAAVWVLVDVAHRRHGIGTRLLDELRLLAKERGRTRLIGSTEDLDPAGAAFAEGVGAECKSRSHLNRLLIADVDRPQLHGWIAEAATRASEYELIGWDGPVPDEHMDRWLRLVLVMNTMPRDDLEQNDFTITAEDVRDSEAMSAAIGTERWMLVARHRGDGEWAGFHDVGWRPSDPDVVWVGATAVEPAHRGHALGKWLKAAMTLRILDERPQVTQIRTGNADSNDAMLGINRAMGYRPWIADATWELRI